MGDAHASTAIRSVSGGPGLEAAGAALGALFTFGLFLGVAHFETKSPQQEEPDIVQLRALSIPMDAPPPRPSDLPVAGSAASPLAGIEVGPSDSDVKVAVVPPELEQFIAAPKAAPAAAIEVAQLYTEFRPSIDTSADFSRIFQQSEVDKIPTVLSRPNPIIPSWVRRGAESLRVVMLLVVNANGSVESVRIVESSGNPEFDAIIVKDALEVWVFTPAMKKGKRVRCLVQFPTRVKWTGSSSPFES